MKYFLQAHVLQSLHAAPNLPCFPANVCEFPLCVEPPELGNNPPPWEAKGLKPHAGCSIGLRPPECHPSEELGQLTRLLILGRKIKLAWCLWMDRNEYILLGAWREGEKIPKMLIT